MAIPQAKHMSTRTNIPVILKRSAIVLRKDTNIVPSASLAGIIKEKREMLIMTPNVNIMSDNSSGSGIQLGFHCTVKRQEIHVICQ